MEIKRINKKGGVVEDQLNKEIKILKSEIKRLKWWTNSENLTAIQEELVELRNYKAMREKEDEKAREEEILNNSFGF